MSAHLTASGRCSECGRLQVRIATNGMGRVIDIPNPCAHFRYARRIERPPFVSVPPRRDPPTPPRAPKVREALREIVGANPSISSIDAERAVRERFGSELIANGRFTVQLQRIRREVARRAA